jgi:hypothetical protein
MTERQRRYREEVLIDRLMEAEEIEEQFLPQEFDWLLPVAMEMLDAEEKGAMTDFDIVVVLYERDAVFPTDQCRWSYRAFRKPPEFTGAGCIHPMQATGLRMAKVEAISLHKKNCIGKG